MSLNTDAQGLAEIIVGQIGDDALKNIYPDAANPTEQLTSDIKSYFSNLDTFDRPNENLVKVFAELAEKQGDADKARDFLLSNIFENAYLFDNPGERDLKVDYLLNGYLVQVQHEEYLETIKIIDAESPALQGTVDAILDKLHNAGFPAQDVIPSLMNLYGVNNEKELSEAMALDLGRLRIGEASDRMENAIGLVNIGLGLGADPKDTIQFLASSIKDSFPNLSDNEKEHIDKSVSWLVMPYEGIINVPDHDILDEVNRQGGGSVVQDVQKFWDNALHIISDISDGTGVTPNVTDAIDSALKKITGIDGR